MCNKTTIECKPSLVQVKPPSHKSEPHDPNVAREITTPNSESQASAGMNPATGGPTMPPAGGMMMPGFFPPAGRYGYHPYYLPPGSMYAISCSPISDWHAEPELTTPHACLPSKCGHPYASCRLSQCLAFFKHLRWQ